MTVANVIQTFGRPTLVLSHNKTLAAQLYGELKSFFPRNAVEYFISYYDYYQPEAYVPTTDTYIEKDASINEDIDRLRLRATSSLMEREDVIIVSTVSAIYGLGDPGDATARRWSRSRAGQRIARDDVLRALVRIQYSRNDVAFESGTFRVRGDTVEIFPAYEEQGVRVEMWGDEIERISEDQRRDRRDDRRRSNGRRSTRRSTSSRPGRHSSGRLGSSARSLPVAWTSSDGRTSCWRRSGWSRERTSTSR